MMVMGEGRSARIVSSCAFTREYPTVKDIFDNDQLDLVNEGLRKMSSLRKTNYGENGFEVPG